MSVLTNAEAKQRFDRMLGAVGAEAFFSEYFGKKPLHIKGDASFGAWLMNATRLSGLLDMASIWDEHSLKMSLDRQRVPTEQYCEPMPALGGQDVMRPSASRITHWLSQGASLICNDIDKLTPELNETADVLEQIVGARVQANLYYSRQQRQAFAAHFDTHHVLAVHCEGRKTWNIYSQRAENPVPHEMFWQMTDEEHEKAKGELLFQAEMAPGDILYLPRGQYHDALADSDRSLHVTFGMIRPTGLDWLGLIYDVAIRDGAMRADLPSVAEHSGDQALAEHLHQLAARVSEVANEPEMQQKLITALRGFVLPRESFSFDSSRTAQSSAEGQESEWSIRFS